ncbi:MAG: hypothetical protein WBG32_17330 [Nodosilinea sp.]
MAVAAHPTAKPDSATEAKPEKLSCKEKREYEQLKAHIPAMESEKAALEKQFYRSTERLMDLARRLE